MKMKLFPLMAVICAVLFTSCKKDDDSAFDQNFLYGSWRVSAMYVKGEWKSISTSASSDFLPTFANFDSDGSCWGSGEFDNYSGVYRISDDRVIVDVKDKSGLTFTIKKLTYLTCEFYVSKDPGRLYRFSRQ